MVEKGSSSVGNKCCEVSFERMGYADQMLCDVIPMDAYRLLLGRPWKYDRNAQNDEWKNYFRVEKDGMKWLFKPQKVAHDEARSGVVVLGEKEFFTEARGVRVCYALFSKEKQKEVEVPKEVESILKDYESIIVDGDMPTGLPPIRIISHQMDLIQGASFPNQEPHRMDPMRIIELNNQVEDFLDKGKINPL